MKTEMKHEDRLRNVVVVISEVEHTDDAFGYSATSVFRYDLEGAPEHFIKYLEAYAPLIEGGQMSNCLEGDENR